MKSPYRLAVNIEWTSKCNAQCAMCPRSEIVNPQLMTPDTYQEVMSRINSRDVFRGVIAGYGEPTTHPAFMDFVEGLRSHPVPFDMVTNGHQLDEEKIRHLDGAVGTLLVSFSSISKSVYESVHVNLDQERVKRNICSARKLLKNTKLAISLTPLPECLNTLSDTIGWFHKQGITALTMSPTLYNRGGADGDLELASARLRHAIKAHDLHSQELDFIPSAKDIFAQWHSNQFKCMPRNTDLFIASSGDYLYCFNDISHTQPLGSVADMSIRQAIEKRERLPSVPGLCDSCNMKVRYKPMEIAQVALRYGTNRLLNVVGIA
jgi:MoaA/NifB/PqqE/SkfB family radical SAM enzyme